MPGFINLPVILLALVVAACALVAYHVSRRRKRWRPLRTIDPVSGQWLADHRRSGETASHH